MTQGFRMEVPIVADAVGVLFRAGAAGCRDCNRGFGRMRIFTEARNVQEEDKISSHLGQGI
jgi:hypothetical protein